MKTPPSGGALAFHCGGPQSCCWCNEGGKDGIAPDEFPADPGGIEGLARAVVAGWWDAPLSFDIRFSSRSRGRRNWGAIRWRSLVEGSSFSCSAQRSTTPGTHI